MKSPTQVSLFQGKKVRKIWHQNEWWFSIQDVVWVLTDSADPKQYIKKMRQRDSFVDSYWGTNCTLLKLPTPDGKTRRVSCFNTQGVLRIVQSIPSIKAEPFKRWLARVGHERIQEINDPELAMTRMRAIYKQKGYSPEWIEKRVRGIAVRNELTDEWQNRGVKKNIEYAILTNEIMSGTFDMKVGTYKKFKGLKYENLRDHMDDLELILTMLGEATTTRITRQRKSQGFPKLRCDAKEGGEVAGETRKDIEKRIGQKIPTRKNYLVNTQKQIK